VSRTKAIAAGGKVYYADGSEAGVVAEQLDVLPMSEPPLKGKLCAELAGRTLPHGSALEDVLSGDGVDLSAALADGERKPAEPAPAPAPKDSRWVLCFDPP
jgi:hypothetical protein